MFPITILSILTPFLVLCGATPFPQSTETSDGDTANVNVATAAGRDAYTMYRGTGSQKDGWPTKDQWVSFDAMFSSNKPRMLSSCVDHIAQNSEKEIRDIRDAIQKVSSETGVDQRFILAVVMQESGGCVRVKPTKVKIPQGTLTNPGLMQDHGGSAFYNDGNGNVQNPCPSTTIFKMIREGTAGTSSGPGLQQLLDKPKVKVFSRNARAHYMAARLYNSGENALDKTDKLGQGGGTHCYCTDIANRLAGWVTAKMKCTLDDKSGGESSGDVPEEGA